MKVITCTDKERSNRVLGLSETLSAAATTDDAWNAYQEALTGIGGKSVVYGFFPKNLGRSLASEIVALSSHPEEFNRLYLEEGYIDHDPFAKYVMVEEERSISWADPRAEKFSSRRSEFFTNSLKDFGMEFGITIPLRDGTGAKLGGTGISLDAPSAREAESALAFLGSQFEEAAVLFHARVQEPDILRQFFPLTPREKECLLWAAAGLTNKEIAFKLSLSEKTVELHFSNASARMNARNRTHAVARALIYKVIEP